MMVLWQKSSRQREVSLRGYVLFWQSDIEMLLWHMMALWQKSKYLQIGQSFKKCLKNAQNGSKMLKIAQKWPIFWFSTRRFAGDLPLLELSHQMRVVCRGRVGNSSRTSTVQVTEVVGQNLELISWEVTIVPQDLVMARPASSLDPLVTQQVEVTFSGVVYSLVHHGSS